MTKEQTKEGIDTAIHEAAKLVSRLDDSPEYAQGAIDALRYAQSYQYGWFHVRGDVDLSWMKEFR